MILLSYDTKTTLGVLPEAGAGMDDPVSDGFLTNSLLH